MKILIITFINKKLFMENVKKMQIMLAILIVNLTNKNVQEKISHKIFFDGIIGTIAFGI